MFHACVERFDVTDTVGKFLGTKRGPLFPYHLPCSAFTTTVCIIL